MQICHVVLLETTLKYFIVNLTHASQEIHFLHIYIYLG